MQPRTPYETPVTEPIPPSPTNTDGKLPAWAVTLLRGSAISIGLGVIFAWFGVYGTAEFPMPVRIVYWSGLIALGAGSAIFVSPLVFERWLRNSHPAVQIAVASILISLPVTIGIIVIETAGDGSVSQPMWWGQQYLYVVVVSALLTTGGWVLDRLKEGKLAAAAPATATVVGGLASPAFADRLPVKFRSGTVYAVSAEDHYLRVHTSVGETMVLMRLADAVRELASIEGLQTHRSWWVAKQGLADASRGDGKVTLTLKSGAEAPVSRTYQKAVKDAGWL
ncbi:MAG: LytTR family DNA-binding domain-containing protein [Hyphomonadaceae bacterium]